MEQDAHGRITNEEAREWYHRNLPGGMPRDWINDAFAILERDVPGYDLRPMEVRLMAAFLHAWGLMHPPGNTICAHPGCRQIVGSRVT